MDVKTSLKILRGRKIRNEKKKEREITYKLVQPKKRKDGNRDPEKKRPGEHEINKKKKIHKITNNVKKMRGNAKPSMYLKMHNGKRN